MSDDFEHGWNKFITVHQKSNQRKSMKDLLWERHKNWKVDRMIFNRVLLEGRLENVKKKYGERIPSDYIDMLAQYDPSGNNKYLAHMVKLLLAHEKKYGYGTDRTQIVTAIRTIGRTVANFHDLNKYIPTEKGGRDIQPTQKQRKKPKMQRRSLKKRSEETHKKSIRTKQPLLFAQAQKSLRVIMDKARSGVSQPPTLAIIGMIIPISKEQCFSLFLIKTLQKI